MRIRWLLITLFSVLLLTANIPAYAENPPKAQGAVESNGASDCIGLKCTSAFTKNVGGGAGYATPENAGKLLPTVVGTIVQGLLASLGVVFLILIIAGGYQWMTAAGAEEKITKAKGLIVNAVIGLIIVLGSYILYSFIGQYLGL